MGTESEYYPEKPDRPRPDKKVIQGQKKESKRETIRWEKSKEKKPKGKPKEKPKEGA